jgi:hypothetical protein
MLRRPYEVLEQAACMLVRSAQPIQQRLNLASSIVGELRSEDFSTCSDFAEIFALTAPIRRKDASEAQLQLDFSHLSDEEAEQLAANVFDAFVLVAKIHLGTRSLAASGV